MSRHNETLFLSEFLAKILKKENKWLIFIFYLMFCLFLLWESWEKHTPWIQSEAKGRIAAIETGSTLACLVKFYTFSPKSAERIGKMSAWLSALTWSSSSEANPRQQEKLLALHFSILIVLQIRSRSMQHHNPEVRDVLKTDTPSVWRLRWKQTQSVLRNKVIPYFELIVQRETFGVHPALGAPQTGPFPLHSATPRSSCLSVWGVDSNGLPHWVAGKGGLHTRLIIGPAATAAAHLAAPTTEVEDKIRARATDKNGHFCRIKLEHLFLL